MLARVKSYAEILRTIHADGYSECDGIYFNHGMVEFCGKTIEVDKADKYYQGEGWAWASQWLDIVAVDGIVNGLVKGMAPASGEDLEIKPPHSFTEFLQNAIDLEKQRGADYDSPDGERSAARIAGAFNAITGYDLTESEVWLILSLLKQVRQWSNEAFHRDSAEDQVTYVALMSESLAVGKKSTKR